MSVIVTVSAAPQKVIALLQLLASCAAPWARTDLLATFAPPVLQTRRADPDPEEADYDRGLLRELQTLGLVNLDVDVVSLTATGREAALSPLEWFGTTMADPDRAAAAGQADCSAALVWMLAQSPLLGLGFSTNHKDQLLAEVGRDLGMTNFTKSQQFFHWARYLGYCWWGLRGRAERVVVPDPTKAIRRLLANAGPPSGLRIPVAEFVEWLGASAPVLEGGTARRDLESMLGGERLGGLDVGHFSASTGIALDRLALEGAIAVEDLSDARGMLLGPPSTGKSRISHVTRVRSDQ